MKKNFYILFIVGILTFSISAYGQKTVVVVQPDAGLNVGALNNAITSAADPGNTIFELKRNGLYLLNGAISHTGYTLHIRAEAGTGTRPVLQPAVDALGASANHFNPGGSLILEGLYIQGRNELGAIKDRQIIVSGNSNKILIDDCIFDYSNQAFIRLTSINNTISIKNSILRNSVRPENPNNGRIIDTRSTPQDTIIIENSTIYNCFANLLSADAGLIKYMKFNHNTVFQSSLTYDMNIAQILKADITNNIFYSFALRADGHSHHALFRADSIFTVGEYTDANRHFNLSNNNFYNQKEFGDILDQYCPNMLTRYEPSDKLHANPILYKYSLRTNYFVNKAMLDTITVSKPPVLWKFIKNGQVDTANVFSEELKFKNLPPLNLDYWKVFVENSFNIGSVTPPNAFADEDKNVLGEVTTGAFDFGYNTGAKSAIAATDGKPLGDPRWALHTPVSAPIIHDNTNELVSYPNPFKENLTFEIKSEEVSSAKISVFNILGTEVLTLDKQLTKGNNIVPVNLGTKLKSGIYFYQVRVNNSGNKPVFSGKLMKE